MNIFFQYLINQGISQEFLVFLIVLPLVVTLITFVRQIIGLKGLGLYVPLTIAYLLLVSGLEFGLILAILGLLASAFMHLMLKRFRLLYLPKMSLILIGTTLIILLFVWLAELSLSVNIIPMPALAALIIIVLNERFVAAQIERGSKVALVLIIETFILAIAGYFLISWPWLQKISLAYPWAIILGVIVINFFLGRWTGLRFFEYQRFKEVFRHGEFPSKK